MRRHFATSTGRRRRVFKSERNWSSAQRYDGASRIHDNRLPFYNKHILQISSLYEFCPGFTNPNDNFYLIFIVKVVTLSVTRYASVSNPVLLLDSWNCLDVGNRTYNSSHCMSGIRRAGRKNITSGTRRAVSNTKRREVSSFSADKRPFSYTYPHKKASFKPINDQFIVARIC